MGVTAGGHRVSFRADKMLLRILIEDIEVYI